MVPFGFGLSYTTFAYAWSAAPKDGLVLPDYSSSALFPSLSQLSRALVEYRVTVTNTGKHDADDVVLGFIVPPGAGRDGQPLKFVFGFERVHVPRGQSVTVFLYPQLKDFLAVGEDGVRRLLRGRYEVQIGIPQMTSQFLSASLTAK